MKGSTSMTIFDRFNITVVAAGAGLCSVALALSPQVAAAPLITGGGYACVQTSSGDAVGAAPAAGGAVGAAPAAGGPLVQLRQRARAVRLALHSLTWPVFRWRCLGRFPSRRRCRWVLRWVRRCRWVLRWVRRCRWVLLWVRRCRWVLRWVRRCRWVLRWVRRCRWVLRWVRRCRWVLRLR